MASRLEMLTELVTQHPNDAFARYGLAMEYANAGLVDIALSEFNKLLELHPDYAAAYFMAAQTLVEAARADEAKDYLARGTAAAARTGDGHALSEMQAMLDELSM